MFRPDDLPKPELLHELLCSAAIHHRHYLENGCEVHHVERMVLLALIPRGALYENELQNQKRFGNSKHLGRKSTSHPIEKLVIN